MDRVVARLRATIDAESAYRRGGRCVVHDGIWHRAKGPVKKGAQDPAGLARKGRID
jgi:hypothetical protein